jgi:hypothetical protein
MEPANVPVPDETSIFADVVNETVLAAVIPELRARVVPLAIVRVPLPNPELFPKERVPRDNVVPPE